MLKRTTAVAAATIALLALSSPATAEGIGDSDALEVAVPLPAPVEVPLEAPTITIGDSAPIVITPGTTAESITVAVSKSSASSDGSAASAPLTARTPVVDVASGTSQSGEGSSSGAAHDVAAPVANASVAPSEAVVEGNSSSAATGLARLDVYPLADGELWVLRSTADATQASDGSTTSAADSDALFIRTDDHAVKVLHVGTDGEAHAAALVVDDEAVLTAEDAAGRCVIDQEAGVAVNCMDVQEGDEITLANLADADAFLADGAISGSGGLLGASATNAAASDSAAGAETTNDLSSSEEVMDRAAGRSDSGASLPSALATTGVGVVALVLIAAGLIAGGLISTGAINPKRRRTMR